MDLTEQVTIAQFVTNFLFIIAFHLFMFSLKVGQDWPMFEMQDKIRKEWQNPMGSHRLGQTWDIAALLLPIRLKTTGRKSESDIFNQATFHPCTSICQRQKRKWESKREMGGCKHKKRRKERLKINWSALPPPLPLPLPLSQDCCARLQIDSDVLIYVLMIGLVCSLCSAMLRLDRRQDHRGIHGCSCTHTLLRWRD